MDNTTPNNTKLASVEKEISVGIWSNLTESVTVYADRTVVKSWTVRWVNNSGSLKPTRERLTGSRHTAILRAVENAKADECEPDDYIFDAIFETQYQ